MYTREKYWQARSWIADSKAPIIYRKLFYSDYLLTSLYSSLSTRHVIFFWWTSKNEGFSSTLFSSFDRGWRLERFAERLDSSEVLPLANCQSKSHIDFVRTNKINDTCVPSRVSLLLLRGYVTKQSPHIDISICCSISADWSSGDFYAKAHSMQSFPLRLLFHLLVGDITHLCARWRKAKCAIGLVCTPIFPRLRLAKALAEKGRQQLASTVAANRSTVVMSSLSCGTEQITELDVALPNATSRALVQVLKKTS